MWSGWRRRTMCADSQSRRPRRAPVPELAPAYRPAPQCRSLVTEVEQPLGNPTNLDLLGALGDPVAAVMTIDVLERLVAAVTEAAEDLHGPVGGVADQSVGPVIGHRNLVRHLHVVVAVQMPGGVLHQ